jgi:hypothetical protein
MALRYEINEAKKLVYAIGTGVVSFSELMNHMEEISQDPRYQAPMRKLVDYRDIKSIELSMDESEIFAKKKASLDSVFAGEKCAVVSPSDIGFGMARIHDSLLDKENPNIDFVVFRKFEDALTWLGVKLEDIEEYSTQ